MSKKEVTITVTVSEEEAEAISKLDVAGKVALAEAVTASARKVLGFIQRAERLKEGQADKSLRLDEVMGNIHPGMEE